MQNQTELVDAASASPPAPKAPQPVTLPTAHDYGITATALTHRAEELEKLARKTQEEGYTRESRAIAADAAAIKVHILPAFQRQMPLPLVSHDKLEKQIEGALRVIVFRAFDGMDDKAKLTRAQIEIRRDKLVELLTQRVAAFAVDVAETAHDHGYASRNTTAESIAAGKVSTLAVA